MADFFIKRPILSICLSIIIVLLGAFPFCACPSPSTRTSFPLHPGDGHLSRSGL
ncbi:MAG: hypothetical protein ACLT38_03250 [Akkermansia sp.]